MHARWAEKPLPHGDRPRVEPGEHGSISKKWDAVGYDNLLDSYSSHVNQVFGNCTDWIDDRIGDWQEANNVAEITWTGTRVGNMPTTPGSVSTPALGRASMAGVAVSHEHGDHLKDMEKAAKVIADCGIFHESTIMPLNELPAQV